jgi:hypothetical protein
MAAALALGALLAWRAVPSWAGAEGKSFDTPEAAGKALLEACDAADAPAAILAILGDGAKDLVSTADAAADAVVRKQVAALARQGLAVEANGDKATLSLGLARWPFPIPLTRSGGAWRFDLDAGREEVLARRIGRDELQAIAVMRAYPDAQRVYASADRDGDGVLEHAQHLRSTPGSHDGLYWEAAAGEPTSPFGPFVAAAGEYGKQHEAGTPWYGYRFRVLTKQGANAPGGAYDYMGSKGDLIGGYALVAWPAEYRVGGVMTFVVGREGRVFQKDLGKDTATAAAALEAFDPDASWTAVEAADAR